MIDPHELPSHLPDWPLHLVEQRLSATHHGNFERWMSAVAALPTDLTRSCTYSDTVSVELRSDEASEIAIKQNLQQLLPWRKGPFQIGQTFIDTEWRSDWKWQRLRDALGNLENHRVLDIGCGNGYFGWRALEAGAEEVIGIDPSILFCLQHRAVQQFVQDPRNWVLPLKGEELPATTQFDLCLSMGVLYHRRDPLQHVHQLYDLTRPGGRGVLETLIMRDTESLYPEQRYARMGNVWCVPSTTQVIEWMQQAGFKDVIVVDISTTTVAEQRSTEWMRFESLRECLNPDDPSLTVEGYPAPVRIICLGHRST